jgi:EAL domain-containing protein (putative c-di-GMP-specific phosphodiesterase class I)
MAEREVIVNVSIGVAVGGGYAEEVLGQADIAMYAAKRAGKGRYALYDASMHEEAWRRLEVGAQLRGVAQRGELVVHYQPVIDLATGAIIGLEALVRWQHPTLGLLPPGVFIDVAEKTGHILEIDRFVLRTACAQLAAWRHEPGMGQLSMNVNMSAVEVRDGSLTTTVRGALEAAGLEPSALCMEITESSLLEDNAVTDRVLAELRELGVRLAIDDFGAGFSNLSYIKRLPVDEIKIDRSLVHGIPEGTRDEAILKAAVAFGKTLGLFVILEGIETPAQYEAGTRVGADAAQGYFMSRPLPAEEITPMLVAPRVLVGSTG